MDSAGPLPKWKFLLKKILILTQKKQFFQQTNFLHLPERTDFLPLRKKFLYLPEKVINFPLEEKIFYDCQEKQFSKQKISYTCLKPILLHFLEKVKVLNFRCVLNSAPPFFYVSKT